MISRKLAVQYGCLAAAVLVAVVGIATCMPDSDDLNPNAQTHLSVADDRAEASSALLRQKAEAHLGVAADEAAAALEKRLKAVRAAFARARNGAPAFAEDSLSWGARWAMLQDSLGVGDKAAHKKRLTASFEKHVFSSAGLKAVLEGAVAGYVSDLQAIEARMLVNLRADVADSDLAGRLPASVLSDEAFRSEFDRLTIKLDDTLTNESRVFLASNAASWAVMDVATPIALQLLVAAAGALGVDTDNLSSGAGAVVATLAVGVVVGLIADTVIVGVLKMAGYDPEADMVQAVRSALDALEQAVWGRPGKPGLQEELNRIGAERAALRQKAVFALFSEGGVR